MPEIKVDHVAEAEQYLLSLDTLTTADAYVAVAAAQAHSTLAQIATAYELADLQRQMLAALQPATPPAEAADQPLNVYRPGPQSAANDEPDNSGDWYCAKCAPKEPTS